MTKRDLPLIILDRRNLEHVPLTAWGRHELVAEIERLRKETECDDCLGTGRNVLALGACVCCYGTGKRSEQVRYLRELVEKCQRSAEVAMEKADAHRRQRDALQQKLDEIEKR